MSVRFENTSDYSTVAPWYDATRNLPDDILSACFERLLATTGLMPLAKILDAGCGTGQLSLPLLKRGVEVTGVDVSEAMLEIARAKAGGIDTARFVVGDVRALEFRDGAFDGTVVSKLFQHVGDWTRAVDEIMRVTRKGGIFAHVNETGAFKNAVRTKFASLCDQKGYVDRYIGLRDRSMLALYLEEKGAKRIELPVDDLTWDKAISYEMALKDLQKRLHAEFWGIPEPEYEGILDEVETWIEQQPNGRNTVEAMHPRLTAEVFVVR